MDKEYDEYDKPDILKYLPQWKKDAQAPLIPERYVIHLVKQE
jgi:hypothetical protein